MDASRTPLIRRPGLGDPVLVPFGAVLGAFLLVMGLGAAVGWLAGRGSATPPAPVMVERQCPPSEPAFDPPLAAPAPPSIRTPAPATGAASALPQARPARVRVTHVARASIASRESWEPARM